jgi:hypothetical protein
MSIKLHDTISISGHFLPALINDDPSGLSVEDSKALIHDGLSATHCLRQGFSM